MKKTLYYTLSLLGCVSIAFGQGSGVHGTSQVHPGGHYGVFGTVNFVSGTIVTPRNIPSDNVFFNALSSHTGASDASHVDGYVEKAGTSNFTFPIGNGTKYRAAGISGVSAGNYRAAYWFVNPNAATLPAGGPFPVANLGTGVASVSNLEYWDVDGVAAVDLTLSWDAASNVNTLTDALLSNLIIVGYNTSTAKWDNLGNAATTGSITGTGTITATRVVPNTYSAFTFGKITPAGADLTATMDIDALNFPTAGVPKDFVVNVYEVQGAASAGTVTVRINKPSSFTITYPTVSGTSAVLGGTANENSNWDFAETATLITVTSKAGVIIPANGQAKIGFSASLNVGTSSGTSQAVTVVLPSGSGGDINALNNRVVSRITATN